MYARTVEQAVEDPGQRIAIPRPFESRKNAAWTAYCLESGYLRVKPRDGEASIVVQGHRYLRTAAPVIATIEQVGSQWKLWLRA